MMKTPLLPFAALAALAALPAFATDISLKNAWMRPARAGNPTAAVYVDITTDVPLRLVGGSTSSAKSVGIVLVDQNPDGTTTDHPVKEADIPAGQPTRFAYNGSRIELRDLVEDVYPGGNVPVTLEFVDPKSGARHAIEIGVLVRGVLLPPAEAGASGTPK
jgi:periplasmic copper chaperone A